MDVTVNHSIHVLVICDLSVRPEYVLLAATGREQLIAPVTKHSGFKLTGTRRLAKNQGNEFANL